MPALKIKNDLADEQGIALLLTLVVLVLLVAVIVEFDYGAKVNLMTAANFRDDVRATYLAKSGVTAARAVLKDDAVHQGTYDDLTEFWAQPVPPYPVGEGFVSAEITDEGGKIDLNRLADTNGTMRDDTKEILLRLFTLLEIDPELVYAIKDWVDKDIDTEFSGGAEEDYYARLDPPYRCKNGPMDTLSELLLVKGVTPEVYRKIRPHLTIVSNPTKPININTADLPVIQSLDKNISPEFAKRIRDGRPYESLNDFNTVTNAVGIAGAGSPSPLGRMIGVSSSYFTAKSHGIMHDTEKIVTALLQRQGTGQGGKVKLISWQIE